MQLGGKPIRVRLLDDLTRYDKRCKRGELGWTIPNRQLSVWGTQDRFVAVLFDNGAELDVLWSGLEKLDEKTGERIEEKIECRHETIKMDKYEDLYCMKCRTTWKMASHGSWRLQKEKKKLKK